MANIGDMVVKVVGDNSNLDKSIDDSKKKLDDFGKTASKIGGKMTAFVTAPLIGLAAAAVKTVSTMEDLSVSFTTMLGDANKASKLLNDLRIMAAKTPFQLTDLANASKTLLQFGVDSEKVLPTISRIGDISQGNAERFKALSLAFGQTSSAGRLMGQDLLQMINAGFNPLKVISDKTGESMASLKDRMSQGAISAEDVAEAFKIATSEGGMFFQGMEKASQTLSGRFSTLKDNAVELARGFGEILYPSVNKLLDSVAKMVTKFSALDDSKKKLIITITKLAVVIGPLTLLTSKAITTVLALKKAYDLLWLAMAAKNIALGPTALIIAGIVALGAAVFALTKNIRQEAKERKDLMEKQKNGIELTEAEEERLAELTLKRLRDNKALAVANLERARSTGATEAQLRIMQANVDKTQESINTQTALIRGLGAEREARLRYNSDLEDNNDLLTDNTEGLNLNADALKENAIEWENRAETIFDLMGEEGRMLILLDSIRKEQYQKEKDRRQEVISKTETSIGYISSLGEAVKNALDGNMKGLTDSITKTAQDIAKEFGPGGRIISALLSFSRTLNDIADKINEKIQGDLTRHYDGYKDIQLKIIDSNKQANDQIYENTKRSLDKQLEAGIISQETYDKKLEEANKQQQNSNRKLARERAEIEKKIALAQVEIDRNRAISELGWFNRDKKKEVNSLFDNLVSAIQGIPLPALKEGGIVMPRPGGTIARIAEAGMPEVIFPIDKLDQILNQIPSNNFNASDLGEDIHLTVQMDSKPILEKIFPATRNRQILIDARAIV